MKKINFRLNALLIAFLATFFSAANESSASDLKSITLTVSEKNVSEALALALRIAAKKHLNFDASVQKQIMDSEVIPYASQFISSYKVVSGGGGRSWVNVLATVDLNALQSILVLHAGLFKKNPVRMLVMVRGFKGGAPWKGVAYEESEELLVARVEAETKERAARRKINLIPRIASYQDHLDGVDTNSAALLRAVALKSDVDLVFFVDAKFVETKDDESPVDGLQLQLETALYERNQNIILANSRESMSMLAGEKALLSKNEKVLEGVVNLIDKATHDAFMRAGSKYLAETASASYLTLRVLDPPSMAAVNELKDGVRKIARVNSVVEREIERGRVDYWIDAGFGADALKRELKTIQLENYRVSVRQPSEGMDPLVALVRLEAKKPNEERSGVSQ